MGFWTLCEHTEIIDQNVLGTDSRSTGHRVRHLCVSISLMKLIEPSEGRCNEQHSRWRWDRILRTVHKVFIHQSLPFHHSVIFGIALSSFVQLLQLLFYICKSREDINLPYESCVLLWWIWSWYSINIFCFELPDVRITSDLNIQNDDFNFEGVRLENKNNTVVWFFVRFYLFEVLAQE